VNGIMFSEKYLGDMIFRQYRLDIFIDIIYIYGRSNESVVESILQRLSEVNQNKLVEQFKDTLTISLKKVKNHAHTMAVITKSHFDKSGLTNTETWSNKIKHCMHESIQEVKELFVLAKFFPKIVASSVWPTEILITLSNYYLLIKEYKVNVWGQYVFEKRWLNETTLYVRKLIFKTIITFIKRLYFGIIGNWGSGFVEKQIKLSIAITNYILEMTANQVIHKDSVSSNCSVIEQNGGAHSFLKKVMKVIEIEPYLYQFEDQSIPNRDILLSILSSVYPHDERGK
jgi:hypothetical protein